MPTGGKVAGAAVVTKRYMKKICLSVGMLLSLWRAGYAQQTAAPAYEKRKLQVAEVNLVSSYYEQGGKNSAVTGGIGSEYLRDSAGRSI